MKHALPLLAAMLLSGSSFAQSMGGPGGQGGQHPPGPPPEAYEACKGKKDGDAATMQTPQGRMQGSCRLVWVPGGQGQGGGQGGQPGQQRQGGGPGQPPGQQYGRY